MPHIQPSISALLHTFKRVEKLILFRNKPAGLTQTETRFLMTIYNNDNSMSIKHLSQFFAIKNASVIQIVNQLEAYGYVKRQQDEHDKRINYVVLTQTGHALAQAVSEKNYSTFAQLLETYGAQLDQTIQDLNGIIDLIESIPIREIDLPK